MFSALLMVLPHPQNHSLYYYGGTIQAWIVFCWCQGSSLPLQGKKYVQMRDEYIFGCREAISGEDWIFNEPRKVLNVIRPLKLSSVVLYGCDWVLYFHKVDYFCYTPVGEGHDHFTRITNISNLTLCTYKLKPQPPPLQSLGQCGLTSLQILTYPTLFGWLRSPPRWGNVCDWRTNFINMSNFPLVYWQTLLKQKPNIILD